MLEPPNAARSIKRHMGDGQYRVRLGGEELSPVQGSAKILAYLKAQAEAAIGEAGPEEAHPEVRDLLARFGREVGDSARSIVFLQIQSSAANM